MEIFSTREIATAVWFVVILVGVFCHKPTRILLPGLTRAAISPKLVTPVLLAALTTVGLVMVLHRVKLWTTGELKDAVIWFLFTGIPLTFRGISTPNPNKAIRTIAKDAVKATVFVEFVLSTYTFPLVVELLLLPLATLLAMLLVVAKTEKKYALAASFLNSIQVCLGIIVIAAILWSLAHHFSDLWSLTSARQFLLPILLTLAFIPVAYLMALISAYEQLFLPLKIYRTPFWPRIYTRIRLILLLHVNLKRVCIAKRRLWTTLGKNSTIAEVDAGLSRLNTDIPAPRPVDVEHQAYDAGYAAGFASASLSGDSRFDAHRQADAEIAAHGYDADSFDQGFAAGTQDADLVA